MKSTIVDRATCNYTLCSYILSCKSRRYIKYRLKIIPMSIMTLCYILTICLSCLFYSPAAALSESDSSDIKKVAVIPFKINSQKDISYIQNGILQMISSRLSWKNKITVQAGNPPILENIGLQNIDSSLSKSKNSVNGEGADFSDFDYIIRGSITEFAGAFSIDAAVYNTNNNSSRSFFEQADTPEHIIQKVEILGAKINKEIFNRETSALMMINDDKKQTSVDSIHADPENLIPLEALENNKKEQPFWKFWDKGEPDSNRNNPLEYGVRPTDIRPADNNISSSSSNISNAAGNNIDKNIEQEENIELHKEIDDEEDDEEMIEKKPFWKFW